MGQKGPKWTKIDTYCHQSGKEMDKKCNQNEPYNWFKYQYLGPKNTQNGLKLKQEWKQEPSMASEMNPKWTQNGPKVKKWK